MSRIDELLEELCPAGVARAPFQEVCSYVRGLTYAKGDEVAAGGIAVLRSNNISIPGNTLNLNDLKMVSKDVRVKPSQVLQSGDILMSAASGSRSHVGKVAYIAEDLSLAFGGFMAVLRVNSSLSSRYLFHFLTSSEFDNFLDKEISSTTINNLSASLLSRLAVPIPPLAIQREIVEILDKFTQLEAELEAELEARKSQYEQTRDQLLDFSGDLSSHPMLELIAELCPEGVPSRPLGSLLRRRKGIPVTAASMKLLPPGDGSVRIFAGGKTFVDVDSLAIESYSLSAGPAIIVKSRGIIEFAFWAGHFSHKNELWSYIPASPDLEIKFAYHYLRGKTDDFIRLAKSKSVKMPQLSVADTDDFMIPVPPIQIQRKIIEILDKFDALVNDISIGLPAELAARRKQYEYYRDKLLAFKELDVA
jgi:type I restriction enzyme S subunit